MARGLRASARSARRVTRTSGGADFSISDCRPDASAGAGRRLQALVRSRAGSCKADCYPVEGHCAARLMHNDRQVSFADRERRKVLAAHADHLLCAYRRAGMLYARGHTDLEGVPLVVAKCVKPQQALEPTVPQNRRCAVRPAEGWAGAPNSVKAAGPCTSIAVRLDIVCFSRETQQRSFCSA